MRSEQSAIKILNMNSHQCPPGPNYVRHTIHKVHFLSVCQHFSHLGLLQFSRVLFWYTIIVYNNL